MFSKSSLDMYLLRVVWVISALERDSPDKES